MILHPEMLLLAGAVLLSGCASISPDSSAAPSEGVYCIGSVPPEMPGLRPIQDKELQAKAQFPDGKGGVCAARTFAVEAPLMLYRVYDAANPRSMHGGWWALTRPAGSREEYRAKNAICPEWSPLDRLVACKVKAGTGIVLGTTQSVNCAGDLAYPKTAEIQVYVPNDAAQGRILVDECEEQGEWPPL